MSSTLYPSLWREGFRAFQQSWRLWARWGILFVGISTLLGLISQLTIADSLKILEDLGARHDKPSPEEVLALLDKVNLWGLGLYALAQVTISSVAYYIFVVFYTVQEQPLGRHGTSSFQGFMSVYWKVFEAWMLATCPFLVCLIAGGGVAYLTSTPTPLILAIILGIGAGIYISYRTNLVMPLSTCGEENPIRLSWNCTQGQVLRLLGNGIIFHVLAGGAILLGIALPAFGLNLLITAAAKIIPMAGIDGVILSIITEITNSATQTIGSGLMAAYAVRSTRILTIPTAS